MAQIVVGAIGAVIGFYVGGPAGAQAGFALGSAAYAAAHPTRVEGSKLTDLTVTGTNYGQAIDYVIGHMRVAGQLIWASDKRAIGETSGGKGGGTEYTSYTYDVDLLVLLSDNELQGVTRIWWNGELVWTPSSSSDDTADHWDRMTVYLGDEAQLPDPTYEAAVTNAPAYRGRTTVMFEGLKLGSSGSMPQLTFEVADRLETTWDSLDVVDVGAGPAVHSNDHGVLCPTAAGVYIFDGLYYAATPESAIQCMFVAADGTQSLVAKIGVTNTGVSQVAWAGTTDTPVIVQFGGTGILRLYGISGQIGQTDLSASYSSSYYARVGSVYSYYDEVLYAGSDTGYYVFRIVGGTVTAVSDALPAYPASMVYVDGYLYVSARSSTNAVYKLNASTLTLVATLAKPNDVDTAHLNGTTLVTDGDYLIASVNADGLYRYESGAWTQFVESISPITSTPAGNANPSMLAYASGVLWWRAYASSLAVTSPHLYTAEIPNDPSSRDLQSVVEQLCERAGMPDDSYDASALATLTKPVRGLAITQIAGTRSTLEMLMAGWYFDLRVRDKLYFVPRGGSSVATIAFEDLGAATDSGSSSDPLALKWGNELELPAAVSLTYAAVAGDYNAATEVSDRLLTAQGSISQNTLAMALTAAEAKGIADTAAAASLSALLTTTLAVPVQAYARIEAADPITVLDADGSSYRFRVLKRTEAGAVLTLEVEGDDQADYADAGITSDSYESSSTVVVYGDTLLVFIDGPLLRDADDVPGYYLAARGQTTPWPGGYAYVSWDGTAYSQAAEMASSAVIGTATTALADWAGGSGLMDTWHTLTVTLGSGQQLASVTDAALLADASVNALWTSSGEVLRFRTATLVSEGVYTLSGLLRGQRGTEWAMAAHVIGETVVLLSSTALRRVQDSASQIGIARYLKGVTTGRSLASATAATVTDTGVSLKPWAPVHPQLARDASTGDLTLSWTRRTRYAARFASSAGINVPLGESSEAYQVDIYNAAGTAVLRTLSVSASSAVYTAAQQTADFGAAVTSLTVQVYQISATVGRGYALTTTLTAA